ncbi:MAG: DUF4445 domain-containing protein [Bacteroidetes bacterium]|nr:DUF4445 domain-containing protein [Bacteroidota bacterium]
MKLHEIQICQGSEKSQIISPAGSNLLSILQQQKYYLSAPCGGHGTCNKCSVELIESGEQKSEKRRVLACEYIIESDLEIILSLENSAKIISESYFPDLNIKYNTVDDQEYGIAIDIGTTTIVVYLEDLHEHKNIAAKSFLNPQKAFGADVISRIQFAGESDGLARLHTTIVDSTDQAIREICTENTIQSEKIKRIVVAGNTTMLHLFKGVDPSSLAQYPFTPVFLDQQIIQAEDIGLKSLPDATLTILPSISAYVGADILAGIAASELPDDDEYALFLDLGTNGEIALGNKNGILTSATAAGPAFEGAKISCGMAGVNGAIHSFSSEEYETIGNTKPSGLCGSGLIDVVAWLLSSQQLDETGFLEKEISFLSEEQTGTSNPLQLTPLDIREVQLAKGAIAAGIETLIDKKGISLDQVKKLYLAGGFGYALHTETAAQIGLFPKSMIPKVIRAGNTAGLGARLSLHSEDFITRIIELKDKSQHFDLSTDMGFNERFVMNMNFTIS